MFQLLIAAFLLAHGAIHASFVAPRPPATAGGPAWPFELQRSWILTPLGVGPDAARTLGLALVAVTVGGFALAAIAGTGLIPVSLFGPTIVVGAVASATLLLTFFHPWLVLGLVIDAGLLWAALVAGWVPASG